MLDNRSAEIVPLTRGSRTDADEQNMAKLYLEGKSARWLGKRYGLSHQGVIDLLRKKGIAIHRRAPPRKDTPQMRSKVIASWKQGIAPATIAATYDISVDRVRSILTNAGINRPSGMRSITITVPVEREVLGKLAHILDTHGRIKRELNTPRTAARASVSCKIVVTTTEAETLTWLEKTIGGKIVREAYTKGRPAGQWEMHRARNVFTLLEAVFPYLHNPERIKQAQGLIDQLKPILQPETPQIDPEPSNIVLAA